MHKLGLLVVALAAGTTACSSDRPSPAEPAAPAAPAAAAAPAQPGDPDVIPGRFIVQLRDDADPDAVAGEYGVGADHVYRTAIRGFAGAVSEAARSGLMRDARVLRVEPDRVMRASTKQTGATWGLDRIDARAGLDNSFSYTNTGTKVNAYIIDTGIHLTHAEFVGRVASGHDAIDGGLADDCNGHGTHVAGTVGGTVYGVAKQVSLVAVRVLDCAGSGSNAGVIAGVDWVTANHVKPAVANMSLGGGASAALDDAVRRSIVAGVTYAIAAGNGNFIGIAQDACKYSPARVAEAITIGATTKTDAKASYSNYGNCVDFFAPGSGITSAWHTGNQATNTISGTSMATPHVAGVAALYLQSNPAASPRQVRDALLAGATLNKVTNAKTVNNHLLFTAY